MIVQAGNKYLPVHHAFFEYSDDQHNYSAESWTGIFFTLFMIVGHPILVTELTRAHEVQRSVMLMLGQFCCSVQLEQEWFQLSWPVSHLFSLASESYVRKIRSFYFVPLHVKR